MNVLITGDVSVYESSGQYQLYVQTMQPDGVGALYVAFEQLKEKLDKEGLFNEEWKSPLPLFPLKIGVVTAQTGAAIQDICTTIGRRFPLAEIILFPAIVQGPQAAPSIVKAIELAGNHPAIDVLIVGRGGGSIEDLWAFNEEEVARAIFSSRIPIISAVGHETDTTIADFVADKRAPTPTAAAELAVPARDELYDRILSRKRAIFRAMSMKIKSEQRRLAAIQSSYPLQYPERLYRPFTEKLSDIENRLARTGQNITTRGTTDLARLNAMLTFYSPEQRVNEGARNVTVLTDRLARAAQQDIRLKRDRFSSSIRMLQALNPLNVMERGYSIIYKDGEVANTASALPIGAEIQIHMQDGTADATVHTITMNDREES